MKIKYLVILSLGVTAMISSCMKEYTCECTHTGVEGLDSTWVTTSTVSNTKKKDAQANCEYLGGTNYSGQIVIEEECTLK